MKNTLSKAIFILPTIILFSVFFFFPLLILGINSFSGEDGFTIQNYVMLLTNDRYSRATLNSLLLAISVTAAAMIIAGIIALFLARTEFRGKNLFFTLITFPVSLPGVVVGFMIIILFGTTGAVPMITQAIIGRPLGRIAYTLSGIFFAYLYFAIPKAVMTLYGAVVEFDVRIEEAARTLGCNEQQAIFKVVIPTLVPAFISSTSITFATAMSAFGTAFTLANQFEILPILMYTEYTNYFNIEIASAMAVIVGGISLAANLLARRILEKG